MHVLNTPLLDARGPAGGQALVKQGAAAFGTAFVPHAARGDVGHHVVRVGGDPGVLLAEFGLQPQRKIDDDLAAYRRLLLTKPVNVPGSAQSGRGQPGQRKTQRHGAATERRARAALRAAVKTCEDRLAKIANMLSQIDARLANPELYQGPAGRIETLRIKRREILTAQKRAEALWLAAEEALEAARNL